MHTLHVVLVFHYKYDIGKSFVIMEKVSNGSRRYSGHFTLIICRIHTLDTPVCLYYVIYHA